MRAKLTIAALIAMTIAGTASGAVLTNVKYPVVWYTSIPCTGDIVRAEGTMHFLFAVTIDDGGGLHIKSHTQPQRLHGVVVWGPNLGAEYVGTGVTQEHLNVKPIGYPYTYTFVNNYKWIGKGQAADYRVHETYHVTVNANGEVTVVLDKVRITCG